MEETARIAGEEPKNTSVLSEQGGVKSKKFNMKVELSYNKKTPFKAAIVKDHHPLAETASKEVYAKVMT